MCFSATVSYGAAAVLVSAGLHATSLARQLSARWVLIALIPLFFGIQQAFEGRVWQVLATEGASAAVPFAVGFHFFSHFLWLWWIPLTSSMVEPAPRRRRLFLAIAVFGLLAGGLVFGALLLHPHWLTIEVEGHSLVYSISSPYRWKVPVRLPPASALYALIILVPLFGSSLRHLRVFGALILGSIVVASLIRGYAFVSVWCFFAAVLSLWLVITLRRLAAVRAEGSLERA